MRTDKLPVTVQKNSLQKSDNGKLLRAFNDRLLLSEAIELVGKLLDALPSASRTDGYLGALANILTTYPRSIAIRCADIKDGVIRVIPLHRVYPTISDIVAWCEPKVEEMNSRLVTLERNERQIQERAKEAEETDPVMRARVAARFKELSSRMHKRLGDAYKESDRASLELIKMTDRIIYQRECLAAGVEAAEELKGEVASPSLQSIVREWRQEAAKRASEDKR